MTTYFEVTDRDAAARRGTLRLDPPIATPATVDEVLQDAGSEWSEERSMPESNDTTLTVLPHRGLPRGTPAPVAEAFAGRARAVSVPSAAVVSPTTATDQGADAYVLSGAPAYLGDGRSLVEAIIRTRNAVPDDTALYLPGVATPATVPILAYLGADLFDEDRAILRGRDGAYLTAEGSIPMTELRELPCSCPVCVDGEVPLAEGAIVAHNRNTLAAALRRVRERIRVGTLRAYVEGQVRHEPWLTAALRVADEEWGYLEARTPVYRDARIDATTEDVLHRVEVKRFADRVTSRYRNRFDDRPLLLVPCSARKPYGRSKSHRRFQQAARYRAHLVSLSSPVGVVPRELELTYPAQHYDTAVTGRWSADERAFIATVLERFLAHTEYPRVIAHVPDGGYRDICERVLGERDIDVTYTVADHPTDANSLASLGDTLAGFEPIPVSTHERATVAAIADYQFGEDAGDELFGDWTMRGRHPKLRVERDGTQLAAVVPEYGVLALTLEGARRWRESSVPTRVVEIDEFVPKGSVLAPGVRAADDEIRPGDEVVVEGPRARAVGRAACHGSAMVEGTRGVAVDVRHVAER